MAYEAVNQEDEQKVQQGFGTQGTQNTNLTTQAENVPTLGGQQSNLVQGQAAQQTQQVTGGQASSGQKSSGMGARLSNLKKYIEANRGSGMAQGIQKGIEDIRTGVQKGIGESEQKLQTGVAGEKARLSKGEQLIKASNEGGGGVFEKGRSEAYTQDITPAQQQAQVAATGTEGIQPQPVQQPLFQEFGQTAADRLEAFSKYRTGEAQQFDIENQAQLETQIKELQKRANLAQSEAGRYQLLRETFGRPSYTTGQQRLDQLLLQADPTESAQLATMAKTVSLPVQEKLAALQKQTETENAAILAQAQGLAGQIETGLTTAQSEFTSNLQKAQEAAQAQIQQAYSQLQDKMARGEPITQGDLEKLTTTSSEQNIKDFLDYYQRGVKQTIGEKLQSGAQFTPEEQAIVAQQVAPKLGLSPEQYNEIKNRQPIDPNTFNENRRILIDIGDGQDHLARSDTSGQYMFPSPLNYADGYGGPFTLLGINSDGTGIVRDGYGNTFDRIPIQENTQYQNYVNAINQQKQQLDQLTSEAIQAFPDIANFRSLSDIDYSQYLRGVTTPELAQVASQEDYARQAALEALAAQSFGPLQASNIGQAGTYGQQDVGRFGLEEALAIARDFYAKPDYQTYGRVGVAETPYDYTPFEGMSKAAENVGGIVEGVTNLDVGQTLGNIGQLGGNFTSQMLSSVSDVEKLLTGGENIKKMEDSIRDMGRSVAGIVGTFWCSQVYKKGLVSKSEMKELRKFLFRVIPTHARFLSWYIDNGQRIADLANQKGFDWNEGKILLFDELLACYRLGHINGAVKCYDEFTVKICEFVGEKPPVECRKSGLLDSLRFLPKVIKFYWSK